MTATLQTATPLEDLNPQKLNRPCRELARLAQDGDLDVNPAYQRTSVWSNAQRVNLIRSLMSGLPVPALVMNNRRARLADWSDDAATYGLIDGKQRIETLLAWYDGTLAVPASWFPAAGVVETVGTEDGPYVTFEGLTRIEANRTMMSWALPTVECRLDTLAEEAAVFGLVNGGGVSQTAEDLARAAAVAEGR